MEDHWSQITVTSMLIIIIKKFEIIWELPKCETDMTRVNDVGKMEPINLLKAGLPPVFHL